MKLLYESDLDEDTDSQNQSPSSGYGFHFIPSLKPLAKAKFMMAMLTYVYPGPDTTTFYKGMFYEGGFYNFAKSSDCFDSHRPFDLMIYDHNRYPLAYLYSSELNYRFCWVSSVKNVQVFLPSNIGIGTIQRKCAFFRNSYLIKDSFGNVRLKILGQLCPFIRFLFRSEVLFRILSGDDEEEIGKLTFAGYTDDEMKIVEILFPQNLDVILKVLAMAAIYVIVRFRTDICYMFGLKIIISGLHSPVKYFK